MWPEHLLDTCNDRRDFTLPAERTAACSVLRFVLTSCRHRLNDMSTTELGLTQGLQRWRLREICRRRLLEEMVSHALSCDGPTPLQEFPASPDVRGRPYLVLVADALTLRVVNSVCQVSDLLTESIWGVQCIDTQRQPLPVLEALYFIAPTAANVEQLMQDIADRGPKYRGFHVFFSHKLKNEQLQCMARSKEVVSCVRSFVELNLSFLPHDDRAFHLGDSSSLPAVLGDVPPESEFLAEIACRLATLLVSLPCRPSILYAAKSAGYFADGNCAGVCERLASEVHTRLEEMESKGVRWQQMPRTDGCTVLIVDRSIDWIPLLVHDMHYEAMLHDVLGTSCISTEEGRFTFLDHDGETQQERSVVLDDPRDSLWEKCRHMPIWEVNDLVATEIKTWRQKDDEMRRPSTASNVSQRVSATLNVLQSLPEHKERFDKLQVHSDICHKCLGIIEAQKLVDVSAFEQDIATGVDRQGCKMNWKVAERELLHYLCDPGLDSAVKTRLLLLFLSSAEGVGCHPTRRRELASHLAAEDQRLPLSAPWLAAQRSERNGGIERRKQLYQDRAHGGGSPRTQRLRRWQPRVRKLIEELARGAVDPREFPELRRSRSSSMLSIRPGTASAASTQARNVTVFIVGGVTLPEVRAAHEAARALGIEVFVGGSCMLTPAALASDLRGL